MVDCGISVFLDGRVFESLTSWNIVVPPQNTDSHPCTRPASWETRVSSQYWKIIGQNLGDFLAFVEPFFGNSNETIGVEAKGNYSALARSNIFGFAYGENPKPSLLWCWDFETCPDRPEPIIFIFGDTRRLKQIEEIPLEHFSKHNICVKCQNIESPKSCQFWKRRAPNNPKYPFNKFLKSWIWDQDLLENMSW